MQVPGGGSIKRALRAQPPPRISGEEVVVEVGATDPEGNLEAYTEGAVVLSALSPEAFARESEEVNRGSSTAVMSEGP